MSLKEKETFVIVDANAFVHSSFNGYSQKLDKKGEDQRVLYGLINSLVDLTYQLPKIDYLNIVFDPLDGSLYRKSLFSPYKENRPPTDPDLHRQREVAKKVLEDHLGLPCISYPGYEADDIIGSMSKLARNEYKVIIISPDKDLAQLVIDDVVLLRKFRTKTERGYKNINSTNIFSQFGVNAHQVPDWLALMGDVADNLPGLKQVGEKKAANILQQYPTLEHLFSILHEIEDEKLKKQILDNKEQLILIKKLATIVCDLPIEDVIHKSYEKSELIRNTETYKQKLFVIKKHYDWPENFIELFL